MYGEDIAPSLSQLWNSGTVEGGVELRESVCNIRDKDLDASEGGVGGESPIHRKQRQEIVVECFIVKFPHQDEQDPCS